MNKKHPNGYWINQLSEENISELLYRLTSFKKDKKFKRVINQTKTDDCITINYCSTRTDRYFTHTENTLTIRDYEIDRKHSCLIFYDYMIELFGEVYAKDALKFVNEFISNNPEGLWSTRFKNLKTKIPEMVEKHTATTDNNV